MGRKVDEKKRDRRSEALFKETSFKAYLDEVCESKWRRLYGRLFQVVGPTYENDLSPNAFNPYLTGSTSEKATLCPKGPQEKSKVL